MRSCHFLTLTALLFFVITVSDAATAASETGVHCHIDALSFDGDQAITEIDYVIPPGDKPPRFRILAGHENGDAGAISVQMKTKGPVGLGSVPLSREPLWKSVVQLPRQRDSAVTSGDITFSHFEPHGDRFAAGTLQFSTADGHRGDCRFRLAMQVVDLQHVTLPR